MTPLQIRVCIALGTRPEAIKLAPVISTFQQAKWCETQVVLTGQHREMVDQVMNLFHLKADHDLAIMQSQQSLTDITCRSLHGLETFFQSLQPHMVLVQGDTTTAGVAFTTPTASFVYTTVTLTTAFDAVLIYNSTQSNKAVSVHTFGSQTITAGTFTLTMPTNNTTNALLPLS